ncbi:MAG: hypothetical protein SFV81_26240 [Pirellulaceae bacterium]|nr:hypothetical protein [Pirellulaceae bacterium]
MTPSDQSPNPFEPSRIDPLDSRSIEWENQDASVLSNQIIVAALCMGVITFGGFTLFQSGFMFILLPSMTTLIGVFAAVSAIVMSFLVPAFMGHLSATRLGSAQEAAAEIVKKLFSIYQVQLIIGCAFLEGAAFLNVILYQLSHNIMSVASAAMCVALMVVRIPTKAKIQDWIASRLPG